MEVSPEVQAKFDQITKLPAPVRIGIIAGLGVLIAVGYFFYYYQAKDIELNALRTREVQIAELWVVAVAVAVTTHR